MSDSSGYGGFSAPGPQNPQGSAPSPYGAGDSTGAGDSYGSSDPYGSGFPYDSANSFGSANSYGSGDSYGTHDPYGSGNGYGPTDPYATGSSAPSGGPFGSPEQAPRTDGAPSHQPSYQPASQPSYQASTAYPGGMHGAGYAPRPTSGMAIAGFVLGLVGLVVACGALSPLGVIFSVIGMQATGENSTHGGRGFAIAGLIISIIGTLLLLLVVGGFVLGSLAESTSRTY